MLRVLLLSLLLSACASVPAAPVGGPGETTRPVRVHGDFNELYRRGGEMKYEGKLVVKCVITITGAVENCRVIRPAKPSQLDTEIAHLLHDWRYHPATRDGVPVETEYVFRLNFEAPPSLSGFPPRR